MQGRDPLAFLALLVGGPGLLEGVLAIERSPGLHPRFELSDALEASADQLLG
jgi:hypothetical protein